MIDAFDPQPEQRSLAVAREHSGSLRLPQTETGHNQAPAGTAPATRFLNASRRPPSTSLKPCLVLVVQNLSPLGNAQRLHWPLWFSRQALAASSRHRAFAVNQAGCRKTRNSMRPSQETSAPCMSPVSHLASCCTGHDDDATTTVWPDPVRPRVRIRICADSSACEPAGESGKPNIAPV